MSHAYANLTDEQYQDHFSGFLINSWSYSKISSFARNEKAFEMSYIYRQRTKFSSTSVAGSAYHEALDLYFSSQIKGEAVDVVDLERVAFDYIDEYPAVSWKVQKTTPTVEECRIKASKTVSKLITNFYNEISTYIEDISDVIHSEIKLSQYLTINGVDIPLPCSGVIDLVVHTKDGKNVIVDHKSKMSFSDDKEVVLVNGKQAITYVNLYEQQTGIMIDEVWFVENKHSANRNGSPQLIKFKFVVDKNSRRLYEALLYEPLKRMIEAVNNPDYVYLINEADNFVDKAEIYEFWMKTMIAEIDDFPNVNKYKRDLIEKRLRKVRNANAATVDTKIIKEFKQAAGAFIPYDLSNKDMTNSQKIEHVLKSFGIITEVAHTFDGYSSDTYLLSIGVGTKITSLLRHKLDIANALDVSNIRTQQDLFVYAGKSYFSIETSKPREKDLAWDDKHRDGMKLPIGMDNFDQPVMWDLNSPSTPHVLICGATGSGKSVAIKSTVEYAIAAGIEDIIFLDPKYEFVSYKPIFTVHNDIIDIENELAKQVKEMNNRVASGTERKTLIIFDEFADAFSMARSGDDLKIKEMVQIGTYAPKKGFMGMMMPGEPKMGLRTTSELKSLQENLRVLLQKGRSVGYRIVAATQRASAKIITGDAKVNFPVQICFRVPKEIDSKVVIDEGGAETLSGKGDGLIKSPELLGVTRFQAFYKP